jgi:hypothetical protein
MAHDFACALRQLGQDGKCPAPKPDDLAISFEPALVHEQAEGSEGDNIAGLSPLGCHANGLTTRSLEPSSRPG